MATAAVLRPNPNPNFFPRRRRNRSPTKSPAKPLLAGHVTILKRGEVLPSPATPPPEQVVVYAGAAMVAASPPPSSLPFPAFCRGNEKNSVAASDIRRMLGLDSIRR